MKIIKPGYEIWTDISEGGIKELQHIERVARTCYKSEDRITEDGESAKKMVRGLIKSGHEAMLEHGGMTVKFIVDRGVSHEIVRHRLFSFAQESTRYCNYSKDKFGNEITVIEPCFFNSVSDEIKDKVQFACSEELNSGNRRTFYTGAAELEKSYEDWFGSCLTCEANYFSMLNGGCTPQEARAVLPNSLKTEIVVTGNWREWRHFFKLRTAPDAHPQIREVVMPLLEEMKQRIPVLFDDIYFERLHEFANTVQKEIETAIPILKEESNNDDQS